MKQPYSSLLCHDADSHGLRQATLLGSTIYFQWNEPILRPICRKFLEQANAKEEVGWQNLVIESQQTEASPKPGQPVWDLNEERRNDHEPNNNHRREKEREHPTDPTATEDGETVFVPHDRIAWYCPAHFHRGKQKGEYGIHFDVVKVVGMGKSISAKASNPEDRKLKPEDWVLVALQICIWHEVCHGWVEDLCSLAESITGVDYYTQATRRYGFYILMEEALCNTAALGMSLFSFNGGSQINHCKNQLQAARDWMRSQPPGYKDFSAKGWNWSPLNDGFLRNMRRLLLDIYEIPEPVATHALRVFFPPEDVIFPGLDGHTHRKIGNLPKLATDQYIECYAYPTHTHPDLDAELPKF